MKKNHRIKLSTLVKSGILAFTAMASMSTMSLEFTAVENQRTLTPFIQRMDSDVLMDSLIIEVGLPADYNPATEKSYPVIYLTDGGTHFVAGYGNATYQAIEGIIPSAIVVGISYDALDGKTPSETQLRRFYDLAPTAVTMTQPGSENTPPLGGGASRFLTAIETELKPFINAHFKVDQDQEIFFGHSLGGTFALTTLFSSPDSFDKYLIVSPSVWWDEDVLFNYEANFAAQHDELNKKIYFAVGGNESAPVNFNGHVTDSMVKGMKKMYRKLKNREYPGLQMKKKVYKERGHLTVVWQATFDGLKYLLNDQP
ncbi:MAG: alpha/beta hydrolase [Pseudomonadales bacterium]|nr:alpha/beta hydrolase [Pseudomonadales bacterium]